jgi:hypothetical protein
MTPFPIPDAALDDRLADLELIVASDGRYELAEGL